MRIRRRLAVALAGIAAAGMLVAWPGEPLDLERARADVTVIGDDDQDAFVGSGSLLLPPQIATDGRRSAAECPGCRWRAVVQCEMTTAGSCRGPARLCGPDGYWLRIYLTRPGGAEVNLGAACFSTGGPVTRETAERLLRDRVLTLVPELRAWRQPQGRALPHLPVFFGVHQTEEPIEASFDIVGLPVALTARPTWAWDFGSATMSTTSAGRPWPHGTITHTYRRSAVEAATVVALWEATYTVAGVGPLRVAQPVTQRASVVVTIGQGRGLLVR